jgi:hypothetical protein
MNTVEKIMLVCVVLMLPGSLTYVPLVWRQRATAHEVGAEQVDAARER